MNLNRGILSLLVVGVLSLNAAKHCAARGGCDCDCSWATKGKCGQDDGSCCWGCCCDPPAPTPPAPAPTPPAPAPTPTGNGTLYCPSQNDFTSGGDVSWTDAGYTVTGPGGVHGKATFNLLGGFVEFDMDTTQATAATNTNFYTSSPDKCCDYCDIQPNKSPQCMEMDIIENNGNCGMATTWHTDADKTGGCDEGGCAGHLKLPGSAFKMRAEFSLGSQGKIDLHKTSSVYSDPPDGAMKVTLNDNEVTINTAASDINKAKAIVTKTMQSKGAMFHSTQWQGWVPSAGECPSGGDLKSSKFSVSNVKIMGILVQGTEPTKCT